MNWLFTLLIALLPSLALAQVVSVDFKDKGFLFSDAPTLTFLWQSKQPKATLVFIPGGEGKIGLTPERANLGGFYGATLRPLSDERLTSGAFNVVIFDSPVQLPNGTDYPYSRQSSEHLLRVQSVVNHFKEKFGLPIWIMGHSNGAVSITEFYKLMQKNKNEKLIDGAIYSSARNGATFTEETQLSTLFLAHEKDGCEKSLPSKSFQEYQRQRKSNTAKLEYVVIKGGEPQGPVCTSGHHMFFGAAKEAYVAIEQFVFGGALKQ
jgi:hypothetical protein